MTLTQDTIYKIAYPKGYMGGKHNLGMSVLKQLPYQLADPVAILKSNTQKNSLVILTSWKDGDRDILIPVHLDKDGAVKIENRVANAYQTSHIKSYLGEGRRNILETKNHEDIDQLLSEGVQFPQAMADDILVKSNIPQGGEEVKEEYSLKGSGEYQRELLALNREKEVLRQRAGETAGDCGTKQRRRLEGWRG